MIKVKSKGNFDRTKKYFISLNDKVVIDYAKANEIARKCISNLEEATPKSTGLTAKSWTYSISINKSKTTITFYNTNIQNGLNVALLLEYGHATSYGSWIEGKEFIDPAIQKVYLDVIDKTWKEIEGL